MILLIIDSRLESEEMEDVTRVDVDMFDTFVALTVHDVFQKIKPLRNS